MSTDPAPPTFSQPAVRSCSAFRLRCLSGIFLLPLAVGIVVWGGWVLWAAVGAVAGLAAAEWVKIARAGPAPVMDLIFGLAYLGLCFAAFLFLREGLADGVWYATGLVLAIAASDTGAYFTGKAIGGPKLAPVISPNKTWAGFGGAVVFCALGLWATFAAAYQVAGGPLWPWGPYGIGTLAAGAALGGVAQIGDLFISLHKRRGGLKDSGALIPGHGGVLDRIDALLAACAAFAALMAFAPHGG